MALGLLDGPWNRQFRRGQQAQIRSDPLEELDLPRKPLDGTVDHWAGSPGFGGVAP